MFHTKTKGQAGNQYSESENQAVKAAGYVSLALANAAILATDIDEKTGLLIVEDSTNEHGAVISVHNNNGTAVLTKLAGNSDVSVAKDTAGDLNVYVENGVINAQNLTGGAIDLTLKAYL